MQRTNVGPERESKQGPTAGTLYSAAAWSPSKVVLGLVNRSLAETFPPPEANPGSSGLLTLHRLNCTAFRSVPSTLKFAFDAHA